MTDELLFASFILEKNEGFEIALHAGNVIEATPAGSIKPLPGSVDFLEGVMQLRDRLVPVINLKKRLGLPDTRYEDGAKVAVVTLFEQQFGLLVDDIKEVFHVTREAIHPVSTVIQSHDRIISALIQMDSGRRMVEVLDLKNLFPGGAEALEHTSIRMLAQPEAKRKTSWSRFVVFHCCGQDYGVPVKYAREITFLKDINEMFSAGILEGVIDLRGRSIPVLRAAALLAPDKAGLEPESEATRVLILASEECSFGMIVSEVREILTIADDEILNLPSGQGSSLTGIYSRPSDSRLLLLDMPNLICGQIDGLKSMSRLKNGKAVGTAKVREPVGSTHHLITENCYLVFSLQKNFALELKDVQEIIEDEEVLAIPGDSGFHSGVIYLRGKIVPVVDLRKFFDFPERRAEGDEKQKLIICSGHGWTVALQVDSIVTIHKQEKYHATPSLHPRLADKKDTLDRLIEFEGENGSVEHVLVVNVYSLVRNHLESGEDGS